MTSPPAQTSDAMKTTLHLLSGGLDSVALLYDMIGDGLAVTCLAFDYGQKHSQELTCAKWHCRRLGVRLIEVTLPSLGGLTDLDWIVPNRNAIFISVAVNHAAAIGAGEITIGCNAGDAVGFPDCRKGFIDAMNSAIREAGFNITIIAPFIHRSKAWIAGLAREMGVPADSVWTCYRGGIEPCGTCPACVKLTAAYQGL